MADCHLLDTQVSCVPSTSIFEELLEGLRLLATGGLEEAIKKVTPECSIHGDGLDLYCHTCGELMCYRCSLRDQKHFDHNFESVGSTFKKFEGYMVTSSLEVEKQITFINDCQARVSKCHKEVIDLQKPLETDINLTTLQLHENLETRRKELLNELECIIYEKLTILNMQNDELEIIKTRMRSSLDFIRECLKIGRLNIREVLMMKKTIEKQISDLAFHPDVLKPNTEANVKFLTYADINAKCLKFGQIGVSGKPDPSQCRAAVGLRSIAIIEVKDYKGEDCEKQMALLHCELVSEITGAVVRGSVKRIGEHLYEISYQPVTKGRHQLHITVEDRHIKGSPFTVAVKKLPLHKLGTPISVIHGVSCPWGLVVNKRGEVIATEGGTHSVSFYSLSGEKLHSFGTHGLGEGQFDDPCGFVVDSKDNILVVDSDNHRIQKFTEMGEFITSVGSKGDGPLQFHCPYGIALNYHNEKIYVAELLNNRIQVLNFDLTFSGTFGEQGNSEGQFVFPWGISCEKSGNVYVADSGNNRIQVFTAEGKFVTMFGKFGGDKGELDHPAFITTKNGYVYVSENNNHRISVFTNEGDFVMSFGSRGEEPGNFSYPNGVTVDESGVVYVCDSGNNRIQLF